MTVHLVNLTNPMMMKGPFRELIPVGEQTVRLRIPDGREVAGVHLLRAGTVPEVRSRGRRHHRPRPVRPGPRSRRRRLQNLSERPCCATSRFAWC